MLAQANASSLGLRSREAAAGPPSRPARDTNAATPPPHSNTQVRYGGATRYQPARRRLAAISGAVVASFFGVFGTLTGAGVMSIFMAVATAGYAHSLATAHR
jgi:hypothetical protein